MNHKNPKWGSYIVENIAIVNFEPTIEYIGVNISIYITYINFVEDDISKEQNFGLHFDIEGIYSKNLTMKMILSKSYIDLIPLD